MRCVIRISLLLAVVLLACGSAQAEGLGVSVGVQAGLALAQSPYEFSEWFDEDDLAHRFRAVPVGGVSVVVRLPGQDVLSLESGLFFQMKGGHTDQEYVFFDPDSPEPLRTGTYRYTWKLAYLTVPALARATFTWDPVKLYVKAGPELGIFLSGEMEGKDLSNNYIGFGDVYHEDLDDSLTPIDLGVLAAGGVEFPVGGASVYGEVSYSYGLTDVMDPPDAVFDVELRNRVLCFMAGVRF